MVNNCYIFFSGVESNCGKKQSKQQNSCICSWLLLFKDSKKEKILLFWSLFFSFFKIFPEYVVVELHMYYYRTFGLELLSELPRRVNSDLRLEVLILRSCWGVTFLLLLLPVFIVFLSELARVTEATLNTPSLYFTGLLSFSRGINSLPPQLSTLMFGKEFSRVNIRFFTAWMWRLWWRDTFLWRGTNNQIWFLDFVDMMLITESFKYLTLVPVLSCEHLVKYIRRIHLQWEPGDWRRWRRALSFIQSREREKEKSDRSWPVPTDW